MSTYVAVLALVLAYVALVAAYVALRTLAKLRRATRVLARGARGEENVTSLVETAERHEERLDQVTEDVEVIRDHLETVTGPGDDVPGALRNIALVRYDAFGEMSGRCRSRWRCWTRRATASPSAPSPGASDTRVYAKGVAAGRSEQDLSPEEQQAVSSALARRRKLPARRAG